MHFHFQKASISTLNFPSRFTLSLTDPFTPTNSLSSSPYAERFSAHQFLFRAHKSSYAISVSEATYNLLFIQWFDTCIGRK